MWEQPAKVAAALKSKLLNASFSGTMTPNAGISGKADISAPSLTRAAAWLGQNLGTPLGQFAFSGGVAASSTELAITKATIGLDDIHAGGSVSVALTG